MLFALLLTHRAMQDRLLLPPMSDFLSYYGVKKREEISVVLRLPQSGKLPGFNSAFFGQHNWPSASPLWICLFLLLLLKVVFVQDWNGALTLTTVPFLYGIEVGAMLLFPSCIFFLYGVMWVFWMLPAQFAHCVFRTSERLNRACPWVPKISSSFCCYLLQQLCLPTHCYVVMSFVECTLSDVSRVDCLLFQSTATPEHPGGCEKSLYHRSKRRVDHRTPPFLSSVSNGEQVDVWCS